MNNLDTLVNEAETKMSVLRAAAEFVGALNAKHADVQEVYEITTVGKRYIKIAQYSAKYLKPGQTPQRAVHAFIDATNGDLLKAAGWNAPAKGARGNIATEEGMADAVARADRFGGYLYVR